MLSDKYPDTYRTPDEVERMLRALDTDETERVRNNVPLSGPENTLRCIAKEALEAILAWQDFADALQDDLDGVKCALTNAEGEQKRDVAQACLDAITEGGMVHGAEKVRRYAVDVMADPECPLPFVIGGSRE